MSASAYGGRTCLIRALRPINDNDEPELIRYFLWTHEVGYTTPAHAEELVKLGHAEFVKRRRQ